MRYFIAITCATLLAACSYAYFNVSETSTQAATGAKVQNLTDMGWTIDKVTGTQIETTWERYYLSSNGQRWEVEMRIVVFGEKVYGQCLQRKDLVWFARPCTLPDALKRLSQTVGVL